MIATPAATTVMTATAANAICSLTLMPSPRALSAQQVVPAKRIGSGARCHRRAIVPDSQ